MTIALTFEKSTCKMKMALIFKMPCTDLYKTLITLIFRAQREHLAKIIKISSMFILHSEFGSEVAFENLYKMHFLYHPHAA